MIQNNYFDNNADLLFTVDHFVDWATIIPLKEEGFKDAAEYKKTGDKHLEYAPASVEEALEGYKAVWQQSGELAGIEIAGAARSRVWAATSWWSARPRTKGAGGKRSSSVAEVRSRASTWRR